jgi:hypothetical protein
LVRIAAPWPDSGHTVRDAIKGAENSLMHRGVLAQEDLAASKGDMGQTHLAGTDETSPLTRY